jgi:hypothetical protein
LHQLFKKLLKGLYSYPQKFPTLNFPNVMQDCRLYLLLFNFGGIPRLRITDRKVKYKKAGLSIKRKGPAFKMIL